jgi:hypothetical protein
LDTSSIYQIEDLLPTLLWIIILLVVSYVIVLNKKHDNPHYKWFFPVVVFKMLMGLFFGYTYIKILGYGGDTVAYWEGALRLNDLFFYDPMAYFKEMWSTPSRETIFDNFNQQTGYPPSWIYFEAESFFVSKIVSIFSFIAFKSFNALTIIFSFIAALASFKLFELVRSYHFAKEHWVAAVVLFFPTIAFWCSGISKDTLTLIILYLLIVYIFQLLQKGYNSVFYSIFTIVVLLFLAFKIRPFMIVAIALPFLVSVGFSTINKIKSELVKLLSKTLLIFLVLSLMFFTLYTSALPFGIGEGYLEEVVVIQKDFASNANYGGPKYDLGITDYSLLGMIKAAPIAILTTLYRPFLWEAGGQGALLILGGIESLFLIGLTFLFFFKGNIRKKMNYILNNKFLLFALLFSLILAFLVGFTAGLFNVLIRFKAPLMAFFVLVLLVDLKNIKNIELQNGSANKQ